MRKILYEMEYIQPHILYNLFKLFYVVCGRNGLVTKYQVSHNRASMSRKIYSNSCKWLVEHFSTWICKNCKFIIKIIGKSQGNANTSPGAIDFGEGTLRQNRETEFG